MRQGEVFEISKPKGGTRPLNIPSIVDSLIEQTLLPPYGDPFCRRLATPPAITLAWR